MTIDRRLRRLTTTVAALVAASTTALAQMPAQPSAPGRAPVPEAIAGAGDAVVAALRARDVAALESRFDDNLRQVLPPDRLAQTFDRLAAGLGTLHDCDAPAVTATQPMTVVEYRCRLDRGPYVLRLSWNPQLRLSGFYFLPPPPPREAPPSNAREEAMTVGARGWPLQGTLLIPGGAAKPPVAVLVQGSGPHDRDETIGPNRVFADLANGLARDGIATLRYDKRTRAYPDRFASERPDFTLDDEVVDDAVAAIVQVARRTDLGPVFVVGHSEGAWLAPRIAQRARAAGAPVAGVVMLAANATPLAELIVRQMQLAADANPPRATAAMVDDLRAERDNVARLVATGRVEPGHEALPFDLPASLWLDAGRYDAPAALLAQPGLPALLTFGERDFQVPPTEAALWTSRLGARPDTSIVTLPRLNHLLIEGDGPPDAAEYGRPGSVSRALIDRVAAWIREHAARH